MQLVEAWFGRVIAALGAVFGLIIAAIALAVTADIFLRNFKLGNIPWLNEVAEYALFYGTFLAVPWVLRMGAHVRVDILVSSLPREAGLRLEQLVDALGLAVSLVLFYYGVTAVQDAYIAGSKQYKMITVSEWFLLIPFALSAFLSSIEFVLRFFRARQTAVREESVLDQSGF